MGQKTATPPLLRAFRSTNRDRYYWATATYIYGPSVGTGLAQRNGADGELSPLHSLGCLFGVWTQDAESMCFHTGELTKTNPRSNPRTNSFGGKVVCTKASARDRPPLGAIPASAGISPIGGQSPFESLVRKTL